MATHSTIELNNLRLATDIGTYGPGDVVPDTHSLDMRLTIDPALVLIEADEMAKVFDYDPLIAEIDRLARAVHYETQERLMTRIVEACAAYPQIEAVEVRLSKAPVLAGTGVLGVHLSVDRDTLVSLRTKRNRHVAA